MYRYVVARSKEAGASFVTGGNGGGGSSGEGGSGGAAGTVPFTPPKNLAHLSLTFRERRPGEGSSNSSAVTVGRVHGPPHS